MGVTRRFTVLHSNDMPGDFLAEQEAGGGELIGGLPLLSGYITEHARRKKMSSTR
jgi:5'-nucleotidase/UDP-sugar diphosphatase